MRRCGKFQGYVEFVIYSKPHTNTQMFGRRPVSQEQVRSILRSCAHAKYIPSDDFRSLLVVHNSSFNSAGLVIFQARVCNAHVYPPVFIGFQRPNFLESGFLAYSHVMHSDLGYPTHLSWLYFSCVDSQHELFSSSYLLTLTKPGESGYLLDADAGRFPLCDCCNRLRPPKKVSHQPLLYSGIAIFDPLPVAANKMVTDFAAALTAVVYPTTP